MKWVKDGLQRYADLLERHAARVRGYLGEQPGRVPTRTAPRAQESAAQEQAL
jgi:hypothetical protein